MNVVRTSRLITCFDTSFVLHHTPSTVFLVGHRSMSHFLISLNQKDSENPVNRFLLFYVTATMVAGCMNQQVDVHSYLTFVRAVVSFLHVFYFQRPIVRAFGVQHREPLVVRVREHARCQDMPVSAADPRYLKSRQRKTVKLTATNSAQQECLCT